jgi:RNA polymerase sigma factor (sigma-70 family)
MIDAIRNGNAFAFKQAYQQSCEKVYAYFLKKTKSPEDAKDLLQTTFLRLWKYRESLSPDFLLDQHLFQIARTVYIDYLRKENNHSRVTQLIENKIDIDASCVYISTEFDIKARLQTALSAMPALRKKVFELNRLQGYSYREIAALLSISVKVVDNNLAKALRHIRKTLLIILIVMISF